MNPLRLPTLTSLPAFVRPGLIGGLAFGLIATLSGCGGGHSTSAGEAAPPPSDTGSSVASVKPALTITVTQPDERRLPLRISANGSIAAWQEASVGTEANGLRLAEVRANVGDVVKKGQVLAVFASDTVRADLAQAQASVAEAEATLAEAAANAQRARDLQPTGAFSGQQIQNYLTGERTAQARLEAARAMQRTQSLRLAQTQVLAPDSGLISARSATVGAVLPAGQELFRLIRQGRLEWRAEVPAADLGALQPGMAALVSATGSEPVRGKVRIVAPTVDAQTRNGLVYVDLPAHPGVKTGMYARGEFDIGQSPTRTLPQSAVLLRDGFHYVLVVGDDHKVSQRKVETGRRVGDRIEITRGVDSTTRVVQTGGGFLSDGDTVRVVSTTSAAASSASSAPASSATSAASR